MVRYQNGRIPPPGTAGSPLFVVAKGTDSNGYWEFQFTQATWVRWQNAKKYAEHHFGRTLYIRTGWNVYRPYDVQVAARKRACASGNCNGAAVPGYSSHGGNWNGRDCLAIDVDPNGLSWPQVWEACRAAGFECGLITAAISGIAGGEPWHIIDFNAFGAVPAGGGGTPFPVEIDRAAEVVLLEDNMIRIQSTNRGIALIGPGYFRPLASNEEVEASGPLVTVNGVVNHYTGNDRQFDLWVSMALSGESSALGKANLDKLAARVWDEAVVAQDANGNPVQAQYPARGYLASTNAQVTDIRKNGVKVNGELNIDEEALGTAIAAHVKPGATPEEVKTIVNAALAALTLVSKE